MKDFLRQYTAEISRALETVDGDAFEKVIYILGEAYKERKQIFIAGNGGSAATANHFVCDFGKNAVKSDEKRFKIISISDNIEKITALGNDIAFESIFEEQLKNFMDPEDVLIVISASGNSPNIVRAVEYARKKKSKVISLTGFKGGKVKALSDVNLNVDLDSYEQIEDIHLIILHMIVYWFRNNPEHLMEQK
jgi:D-sedoheptulose 7-phosphate isomerase